MIPGHTSGGTSARFVVAHRAADAVQTVARLVLGTILVVLTHSRDARYERIALRAQRTNAHCPVALGYTVSPTAALSSTVRARTDALLVETCLIERTLRVDLTFRCKCKCQSFANEKVVPFIHLFWREVAYARYLRL